MFDRAPRFDRNGARVTSQIERKRNPRGSAQTSGAVGPVQHQRSCWSRVARRQTKHYVIARGSAMECGAVFDAALVLKLVDQETANRADELITRIVEC